MLIFDDSLSAVDTKTDARYGPLFEAEENIGDNHLTASRR